MVMSFRSPEVSAAFPAQTRGLGKHTDTIPIMRASDPEHPSSIGGNMAIRMRVLRTCGFRPQGLLCPGIPLIQANVNAATCISE